MDIAVGSVWVAATWVPYLKKKRFSRLLPLEIINALIWNYLNTKNTLRMSSTAPEVHEFIKPLSWLLGKWKSVTAKGIYPTIEDFEYIEELEFFHVGQPNIQFTFYSRHSENNKPLHREVGFIKVKPGTNQLALSLAQNNGLVEVAEGEFTENSLKTQCDNVGRLSFGKDPKTKKIMREFKRDGDSLEQVVHMETDKTQMSEHLRVKYIRA